MKADYRKELRALVLLNSYQQAIQLIPFDKKYADFIFYGLSQIEGIRDSRVCIGFSRSPSGPLIHKKCRNCTFFSQKETEKQPECLLFDENGMSVVPIRTAQRTFGYIAFKLQKDASGNIAGAVNNFANSIAISIENQRQKDELAARNRELSAFKDHLETLVWERTRDLEASHRELKKTEGFLRAMIACSPVALYSIDAEGLVTSWNESAERIFGWSADEVMGKPLPMIPADKVQEYEDHIREVLSAGDFLGRDLYRRRKDGSLFPVSLSVAQILDDRGKVIGIMGAAEDITERKTANEKLLKTLQDKETLLRELNHRINNTMQILTSMVHIRARRAGSRDVSNFATDLNLKIATMSLVHQKLYNSADLSHISLKEYLEDLAVYMVKQYPGASNKISLHLDLEEMNILIDTAIPCGLVMNELLTNSLTHGFPPGSQGDIFISTKSKPDGTTELIYRDTGEGVPEHFTIHENGGMGLRLVKELVEHQMDGTFSFEKGEQGPVFTIEFPDNLYTVRI